MSVFSEFLLGEKITSPIVPKYLSDYISIVQREVIQGTVVCGSEPPIGETGEGYLVTRYNISQDITNLDNLKQWSNLVITPTGDLNGHRIEIYNNMDFENPIYTGDLSFPNNFHLCLIPHENMMITDNDVSEADMLVFKKIITGFIEEETNMYKIYMQTKVKIYDSTENLILEANLILENILT